MQKTTEEKQKSFLSMTMGRESDTPLSVAQHFASKVFTLEKMQEALPREVYKNVIDTIEGREKIRNEFADVIAKAMQEWAASYGATHYCHWFQPLTGKNAEKHDSFLEWKGSDSIIECFDGSSLIQGEPDASSFPSGGLRSTYEARGYTGWDPASPVFIWEGGDGATLCIPSVFFSWTGDALDNKIPLLRSDKKINDAALRLLQYTDGTATQVFSTLGWEQEYFIIDREMHDTRPDLLMLGQTVYGASAAKGQDLQDHYFACVKDRILSYMLDFESEAMALGIPVKTRHNEVAPAQHEVAALFSKASRAVDQNILIMELMRQVAAKHNLACLLHEKPFAGLNGSGKHNNWSLATDTGLNLLDPKTEKSLQFLVVLTAILHAVHKHSALLRAAIASAGNDARLGGHEAPPPIISVYLGEALEMFLENIEKDPRSLLQEDRLKYDLGILTIPEIPLHNTDRNRTSPFAFTGNKFEYRAVGSSASCALPITVLNVIVAESLNEILDRIEQSLDLTAKDRKEAFRDAALPVIQQYLKASKAIRFSGDNYSPKWEAEAKKRQLPCLQKTPEALQVLTYDTTVRAFEGVLNFHELESRKEAAMEKYCFTIDIEVQLMISMFRSSIFPASVKHQKQVAEAIHACAAVGVDVLPQQKQQLFLLNEAIAKALDAVEQLEEKHQEALKQDLFTRATNYAQKLRKECCIARECVDALEKIVDDEHWPFPKYYEILFLV